jgi:hypothetical protein
LLKLRTRQTSAIRHDAPGQVQVASTMLDSAKDRWLQLTGPEPAGGNYRGRHEDRLASRPDDPGRPGAKPEIIAALELDQEGRAGPGPAEDQNIGWNDANDYRNEANDYGPDNEAGE